MLVVAAATCLAALLAPVAAGKPPPLAITGITVTGVGQNPNDSSECVVNYTVDFVGHLRHGDYSILWHSNSSDHVSSQLGHARGSYQVTSVNLSKEAFSSGSMEFFVEITDKNGSVLTLPAAHTAVVPASGSCPTGTYS